MTENPDCFGLYYLHVVMVEGRFAVSPSLKSMKRFQETGCYSGRAGRTQTHRTQQGRTGGTQQDKITSSRLLVGMFLIKQKQTRHSDFNLLPLNSNMSNWTHVPHLKKPIFICDITPTGVEMV